MSGLVVVIHAPARAGRRPRVEIRPDRAVPVHVPPSYPIVEG